MYITSIQILSEINILDTKTQKGFKLVRVHVQTILNSSCSVRVHYCFVLYTRWFYFTAHLTPRWAHTNLWKTCDSPPLWTVLHCCTVHVLAVLTPHRWLDFKAAGITEGFQYVFLEQTALIVICDYRLLWDPSAHNSHAFILLLFKKIYIYLWRHLVVFNISFRTSTSYVEEGLN